MFEMCPRAGVRWRCRAVVVMWDTGTVFRCSARSIHGGSVVDAQHDHGMLVVIDLVLHSVGATTGGVEPSEFALQPSSDAVRVFGERRQHELDDRSGGALGQAAQLTLSRPGDTQLACSRVVAHVAGNRARSSSPVT